MELERLYTTSALAHEIAVLLAEAVQWQAQRLVSIPADKDERAALRKERRRVKDSSDWFDRLIVERMALDAEQQKAL